MSTVDDLDYLKYEDSAAPHSEDPSRFDVLSGQGRKTQSHPGNIRYAELLSQSERKFLLSDDRHEKQGIVYGIIREIHVKGRFLFYDHLSKSWCLMKDEEVYDKVSQALRYRKRMIMKSMDNVRSRNTSVCGIGHIFEKQCTKSGPLTIQFQGKLSRSSSRFSLCGTHGFYANTKAEIDPVPLDAIDACCKGYSGSNSSPNSSRFSLEDSVEEIFSEPRLFTRSELAQVLEAALDESERYF